MKRNSFLPSIVNSMHNEKFTSDPMAKGAFSRCIESSNTRMRVMLYPSGFISDHTCYKGHALYVVSGSIKIHVGEETVEWSQGDAFIIPDDVPHIVCNDYKEDAKVVIVDNISKRK